MDKQQTEFFDRELWYRIKIHRWTFVALVIIAIMTGVSMISFKYRHEIINYLNETEAGKKIERAKVKLANAESLGISDRDLEDYRGQIKESQRLFDNEEYTRSMYLADSCLNGLILLIDDLMDRQKRAAYAIFTYIDGKVEIQKPGNKMWITAKLGTEMPPGTKVRTHANTRAEFTYKRHRVTLREDSFTTVQELSDRFQIRVEERAHFEAKARPDKSGDTFSVVQEEVKLETGNATDLEYKGENKNIDLSVYKGTVNISQGQDAVTVRENQALEFVAGEKMPLPEMLIFPPELVTPDNVSLLQFDLNNLSKVILRWTKAKQASGYLLEVANDTYFRKLYTEKHLQNLNFTLEGVPTGTYFWRVASLSESGRQSSFTDFWSFRVIRGEKIDSTLHEKQPPKLFIDEVRRQGYLVIIKGRTDPGATLLINDEKHNIEENGNFTVFCPVEEILTIDVFDSHGNVTSKKL